MATGNERAHGWYWDSYWSADRAASCFEGPGAGYEDSISRTWQAFFAALPNSCAVLDIGTGNGAVAAIANRTSRERGLDLAITGIDQAAIDPQKHLTSQADAIAGVTFMGSVSADALPFDDGHFGALASQFALEYMDPDAVLPELARIASPGAPLQCVIHAKEGLSSGGALRELEHCDYLLAESALFQRARQAMAFVVTLERRGQPVQGEEDKKARQLIHAFETGLQRLARRRQEIGPHVMLDNVQQVLTHLYQKRQVYSADQLQQHVDTLQGEVEAHAARLGDLRDAARDMAGCEELAGMICTAGFTLPDFQALLRPGGGGQLGWLLQCKRNSGSGSGAVG